MENVLSITNFNETKKLYAEAILRNAHIMNGVKHIEIPLGLIVIDEPYQRKASGYAYKIAGIWDNHKCKDIIVSYRDYEFKCVDGANRVRTAKIAGQSSINCIVYEGLKEEDKAKLFAEQDDFKRRVSSSEKFNARVIEGDYASIEIEKVCDAFGVKIRNAGVRQPGAVSGVCEVESVYRSCGTDGLAFVFQVIRALGWHTARNAYSEAVIGAFAHAYKTFNGSMAIVNLMQANFADMTPDEFIARAVVEFKNRGRKRAAMAYVEKRIMGVPEVA